nr:MAG TPA: hypothetical protein [Caudoviricetes sp.]
MALHNLERDRVRSFVPLFLYYKGTKNIYTNQM